MTDKQSYHDAGGNAHLFVRRDRIEGLILRSQVDLPDRTPIVVAVPPAKLLAMIDTVDPDAMRAYLRERSDYLDSPAAGAAAEHFDYLERPMRICDPVPEADSPEDTDERPERDVFQWEEPPALTTATTAEHPATVYFDGLAVMLRARPVAWAKIAENVKTARYIKPMKDRGCEITTRNNDRSTRKGDVYARFVGQR